MMTPYLQSLKYSCLLFMEFSRSDNLEFILFVYYAQMIIARTILRIKLQINLISLLRSASELYL